MKHYTEPKMADAFGLHLTLDLYHCNQARLGDMELCFDALFKLPPLVGMKILLPPVIIKSDSNEAVGGKDPGGFSGFVMITESHISLHTFIKREFVSIDAYSCKHFDANFVIQYFKDIFQAREEEVNIVVRGKKYPQFNVAIDNYAANDK